MVFVCLGWYLFVWVFVWDDGCVFEVVVVFGVMVGCLGLVVVVCFVCCFWVWVWVCGGLCICGRIWVLGWWLFVFYFVFFSLLWVVDLVE